MSLRIRAVTFAIPYTPEELLKDAIQEILIRKLRSLKEQLAPLSPPVWTYRLILKPSELECSLSHNVSHIIKVLDSLRERAGFDYIALPLLLPEDLCEGTTEICRKVVLAARGRNRVFVSLNISSLEADLVPKLATLYSALLMDLFKLRDYSTQVRISLVLKGPIMTPYFPSGASLTNELCMMAALLYPKFLSEHLRKGIGLEDAIRRAYSLVADSLERVALETGVPFVGVDLSISPWIKDSVVDLLELIDENHRFIGPTFNSLVRTNLAIKKVASEVRSVGFNEVMLPLAEDERLKELVLKGLVRMRDFIAFAIVCVAGVDMIPIPGHDQDFIRSILSEALSVALIKERPMGIRLIAVDGSPGDNIKLWNSLSAPIPKV